MITARRCWAIVCPEVGPLLVTFRPTRTAAIDIHMMLHPDKSRSWEQERRAGFRAERVLIKSGPWDKLKEEW